MRNHSRKRPPKTLKFTKVGDKRAREKNYQECVKKVELVERMKAIHAAKVSAKS